MNECFPFDSNRGDKDKHDIGNGLKLSDVAAALFCFHQRIRRFRKATSSYVQHSKQ